MDTRISARATGSVDVVVIGAGQSGLAMSYFLSERGIEHVVLERGEVANSWRKERWDSLRMLTPNWQMSLPGYAYSGPSPDSYMTMPAVVDFMSTYAQISRAPIVTGAEVQRVTRIDGGYLVTTPDYQWIARAVVLASGAFTLPNIPAIARAMPPAVLQLSAREYRHPGALPAGGVLVVGGSATGVQLADEIHDSGRPVTLAVGEHVRMPRTYRGRDIQHWMHVTGLLDERYDTVDDVARARGVASPQLIGSDERRTLDLNALTRKGVRLNGRLAAARDSKVLFSGSLRNVCKLADLKLERLLDTIDAWIAANDAADAAHPAQRFAPTQVDDTPCLGIDLRKANIETVVWATGFRPDYSWLDVPVLDRKGNVIHDGGVVNAPGLYILGLPFMRRRKSSFVHGAEDDARDLAGHLAAFLDACARSPRFQLAI
jgi:putative flavoprotein involved in K+ transport